VPVQNLRQFLEILRLERDLVTIDAEVDPCLEVAEIHRRVIESRGPALLFNRVKGCSFPVVTNLFGTPKRIELAFGTKPQALVKQVVHFAETLLPPKFSKLWDNRNLALELLKLGTSSDRCWRSLNSPPT
jgi:UbiD family decarboxylase